MVRLLYDFSFFAYIIICLLTTSGWVGVLLRSTGKLTSHHDVDIVVQRQDKLLVTSMHTIQRQ